MPFLLSELQSGLYCSPLKNENLFDLDCVGEYLIEEVIFRCLVSVMFYKLLTSSY